MKSSMKTAVVGTALVGLVGLWGLVGACGDDSGTGGNQNQQDGSVSDVTVSISAPAADDLVSGIVSVSVAIDGQADHVVLSVDGRAVAEAEVSGTAASVDWDTTGYQDGVHRLSVAASLNGALVGESEELSVSTDNTAPVITMDGLERPYVFTGQTSFTVQVEDEHFESVTFTVDGVEADRAEAQPAVFDWDPAGREDGAVTMSFVATDQAGNSAEFRFEAAVILQGQIVDFTDGDGVGNFFIPENYTPGMEIDQKFHWNMEPSVGAMMGVVQWEYEPEDPWNLKLDLGSGFCPHSGTLMASEEGSNGQIIVNHTAQDLPNGVYGEGQFFSHLGAGSEMDPADKAGQGVHFWMVVAVYTTD